MTYATLQGFGGGSDGLLLTIADGQERNFYEGADECPFVNDCLTACENDENADKRNYYVRRATYFVASMYSTIFKYNLEYLPSTFQVSLGNINIAPTVFIDTRRNHECLYIYYTNVKPGQSFTLDPHLITNVFPDCFGLLFNQASCIYLQADNLYSTSGKSSLYDPLLNACYPEADHPLEMKEVDTILNYPICGGWPYTNGCLVAPEYSIGYFKVPLTVLYEVLKETAVEENISDILVYPNPASSSFTFVAEGIYDSNNTEFTVEIRNLNGMMLSSSLHHSNEKISIADLPAGIYFVDIKTIENKVFHKQLIKIK